MARMQGVLRGLSWRSPSEQSRLESRASVEALRDVSRDGLARAVVVRRVLWDVAWRSPRDGCWRYELDPSLDEDARLSDLAARVRDEEAGL